METTTPKTNFFWTFWRFLKTTLAGEAIDPNQMPGMAGWDKSFGVPSSSLGLRRRRRSSDGKLSLVERLEALAVELEDFDRTLPHADPYWGVHDEEIGGVH